MLNHLQAQLILNVAQVLNFDAAFSAQQAGAHCRSRSVGDRSENRRHRCRLRAASACNQATAAGFEPTFSTSLNPGHL
jgi:hypothetical protein